MKRILDTWSEYTADGDQQLILEPCHYLPYAEEVVILGDFKYRFCMLQDSSSEHQVSSTVFYIIMQPTRTDCLNPACSLRVIYS